MRAALAARLVEAQRVAQLAASGGFAIEVTADGVRLRDDLPVPLHLTDAGRLVLLDADEPIPYVVAS